MSHRPQLSPNPAEIHRQEVDGSPAEVWAALHSAADAWGAEWEPGSLRRIGTGRLRLPVTAGIRFGVLDGELRVGPAPGASSGSSKDAGSELTYRPETSLYFVNTKTLAILVFAALGGLLVVIWPFFPQHRELAQIAPLGAVLALVGWFLVISRLENRGPREFLELVALETESAAASEGAHEGEPAEPGGPE